MCSAQSAVSPGGFHGRHFSCFGDQALLTMSMLLFIIEATGTLPRQLAWVLLAFLPKPAGGVRATGIFP
eukprot:5421362-Pyramimonas_sp.AAC.1